MSDDPATAATAPASVVRHPVQAFVTRRHDLDDARAESRMSAYVYGEVLVLAATAGVSHDGIRTGEALLVVLGTVVSTYIAHVLADVVGAVFAGHASRTLVREELRDSVPVVSAGLPSFLFLGAAALHWISPIWAQVLACTVLILRLAATGLVYRRLRAGVAAHHAFWFGIIVAAVATVSAALKLWLTH